MFGGAAALAGSLFLPQSVLQGACFRSQYFANLRMFRQGLQEFRVCTDYFVDFFRGLQLLYNMVLEQLAFVGVEFLYFTVSEYSQCVSHGYLLEVRVGG
jgi:hypothetical protein